MDDVKRFLKQYMPFIVALVPILLLRDFTPANELKYLAVAREALQDGHFFALTLHDEPYVEFPPLYFWLLMASKVIFRHWYMVQLGLFSLIPALLIVHYMNKWVSRYEMGGLRLSDGSQSRDLAQWMLFTSGLMFCMSAFIRMDMLFCLFIVLALYHFWQILYEPLGPNQELGLKERKRPSVRHQWYFGIFVFLAIFTKGLWGLAIPLLATSIYLLFAGRMGRFFHLWSWRTMLVIVPLCAGWYFATMCEGGPEYCMHFFERQTYTPLIYSFHHSRPWFYYIASVWWDTLPWGPLCMVLLIAALCQEYKARKGLPFYRRVRLASPLQGFFAAIFLSTLIFLSCLPGKIDVRLLPVFPFLIYVGVMQLGRWQWPLVWQWRFLWVCRIVLIAFFVGGCFMSQMNTYIGCYGHLCWRANDLRRELHTEHVYVWQLPQMEHMEVYLHEDPIKATYADFEQHRLQNTLLLTTDAEYKELLRRLSADEVNPLWCGTVISALGPYVVVKFE